MIADRCYQTALDWARAFTGANLDALPSGEPGEGGGSPLARACELRLWWRETDLDGIPCGPIFFLLPGEHGFCDDPAHQLFGDVAEFVRRFEAGRYPELDSGLEPVPHAAAVGEMRGFHHLSDDIDIATEANAIAIIDRAQREFRRLIEPS